MDIVLNDVETRVLGSLIEKEITTPDYYPLSLNALVNACNQKSNRDPVMNLDEGAVTEALRTLRENGLAGTSSSADSRVTKYEHRLQEVFNFTRPEIAVLCVLLLRGPQTPGELRGRTERMFRFGDLSEVQGALQRLIEREPPIVKMLARQPGTKEARYAQLLSVEIYSREPVAPAASTLPGSSDIVQRLAHVEEEVAHINDELSAVKRQLASLTKPT
ncbi:MAG: YceH family protein [Acidobacteria bacterium]|nr:YceH family protein [Acidobacteriota bacterium]